VEVIAELPTQPLSIPETIEFESSIVGNIAEKTFNLINESASAIEFNFSVEEPFSISPVKGRIEPNSTIPVQASCYFKVFKLS
jgi:hypothetical protein